MGRSAWASISARRSRSSARGPASAAGRGLAAGAPVSASNTSSGTITATGPGVPLSATWKARAIASDARFGSLTSMTSLVTSDEEPAVVLLLQRHAARLPALDLADQHDHRRRVMPGGVETDHRVRQAGSARYHQHPGAPAAHAPVRRGHERRPALMAADDQPHAIVIGHRVGEAEIALAGHAIDDIDVVRFEAVDDGAADGVGHGDLRQCGKEILRPSRRVLRTLLRMTEVFGWH